MHAPLRWLGSSWYLCPWASLPGHALRFFAHLYFYVCCVHASRSLRRRTSEGPLADEGLKAAALDVRRHAPPHLRVGEVEVVLNGVEARRRLEAVELSLVPAQDLVCSRNQRGWLRSAKRLGKG